MNYQPYLIIALALTYLAIATTLYYMCVRVLDTYNLSIKASPDGRNTHLIQRNRKWWHKHLSRFFVVAKIFEVGPTLMVIVGPKVKEKKVAA